MSENMKRREFIKTGTVLTAGIPLGLAASNLNLQPSGNDDPIRIGVIGTGDRGEWECYILKETPGIDVVACCDILPKHLEKGLKEAVKGAKGYENYKELLEQKDIDAVLIATPQHLHYQMVLDTLDTGKHIICEKTMTLNTEEAISLSKAVKKSKSVFPIRSSFFALKPVA